MGFYGNITNTNRTQFVFDKVFANRAEMDGWLRAEEDAEGKLVWKEYDTADEAQNNIDNDGIFIGRYVLVDYDKNVLNALPYRRIYADENKKYFYFSKDLSSSTVVRSFKDKEETYYIKDDQGNYIINPKAEDDAYAYYIFWGETVYTYEDNKYTFYQINGITSKYFADLKEALYDVAQFEEIKLETSNEALDSYYSNYSWDRGIYKAENTGVGRGWDSTVWQKTYTEGKSKYVMIAELNSVVPTFDLTIDQPTIEPVSPHFDADSTNVYYRLHVQPSWGFKIKETDDVSDEIVDYNAIQNLNNIKVESYNGDIYYNKDGFDADYHYDKEKVPDSINVSLGSSGAEYNTIENHDGTNVFEKKPCEDTQELSIHLSSLGDSVSAVWDMVYGTGKEAVTENADKKYRRNKDISWDSVAGLRLVTSEPTGNGFEYTPDRVETMAGCINSVHDLMGMIIVDEDPDIEDALTNRIYYRENGYYIKDRQDELIENGETQRGFTLGSFPDNLYFKTKDNYYLENESSYEVGNTYYQINEGEHVVTQELSDYIYEPDKYSYEDNGSYIIETTEKPVLTKDYYLVNTMENQQALKVTNQWESQNKTFRPDQLTRAVFDELFGELSRPQIEKVIEGATYRVGESKGLFYLKVVEDKPSYILFDYDNPPAEAISNLYYIENYYELWNGDYSEFIPVADSIDDYVVNVSKPIPVITFKENTFYYEDESGLHLVGFDGNGKISIGPEDVRADTYKTFFTLNDAEGSYTVTSVANEEVPFYTAGDYYYKDNQDYIQDNNTVKTEGIQYYKFIKYPDALVSSEKYYKANTYYYKHEGSGTYVLDGSETVTEGREYYYYPPTERYVIEGNGVYSTGAVWNEKIATIPEGVTIGTKAEAYQWKELVGFARSLNTIHGLILKINNILKSNDKITRDLTTVQGCINTLNDIIEKFDELNPGDFLIVNQYGKINTASSSGDDWIAVSVDPIAESISFTHTGPVEEVHEAKTAVTPKFGETFDITDYWFDDRGHRNEETTHTIAIPQGSLTDAAANGQDVITQLDFEPTTGALSTTRTNLSVIKVDENTTLDERLVGIDTGIREEAAAREAKDNDLQSQITNNGNAISQEATDRAAVDEALQKQITDNLNAINQEIDDRTNAISSLQARNDQLKNLLDNEVVNRSEADAQLQSQITQNKNDIDSLKSSLNSEASQRESIDNNLQAQITALSQSVSDEISTRESSDNTLAESVTELMGQIASLEENSLAKTELSNSSVSYISGEEEKSATLSEMLESINKITTNFNTLIDRLRDSLTTNLSDLYI